MVGIRLLYSLPACLEGQEEEEGLRPHQTTSRFYSPSGPSLTALFIWARAAAGVRHRLLPVHFHKSTPNPQIDTNSISQLNLPGGGALQLRYLLQIIGILVCQMALTSVISRVVRWQN